MLEIGGKKTITKGMSNSSFSIALKPKVRFFLVFDESMTVQCKGDDGRTIGEMGGRTER